MMEMLSFVAGLAESVPSPALQWAGNLVSEPSWWQVLTRSGIEQSMQDAFAFLPESLRTLKFLRSRISNMDLPAKVARISRDW